MKTTRRYELAIFDFDGTLADSFPWFSGMLNDVADKYGFRRIDEAEGQALRLSSSREILRRLEIPLWKVPMIASHVRGLKATADIPLFAGATDLLVGLHARGIAMAIVSSDTETNIRQTLGPEAAGLIARFDCSSSLFGKATKLLRTSAALGVAPHASIYVGDEVRDGEAAKEAGMAFGAVAWGYTHPDALAPLATDPVFRSFDELDRALR